MAWDGLVQQIGKYRSIRHMEYPKFQTGIFGRMESALLSHLPCIHFQSLEHVWPKTIQLQSSHSPEWYLKGLSEPIWTKCLGRNDVTKTQPGC